jgi:hypothetical protein
MSSASRTGTQEHKTCDPKKRQNKRTRNKTTKTTENQNVGNTLHIYRVKFAQILSNLFRFQGMEIVKISNFTPKFCKFLFVWVTA